LFAFTYPYVFLEALGYAGGFGCALLLGLLPILMAWRARYYLGMNSKPQLPGGRIVLVLLILFVLFEIGCEVAYMAGKF
jgi:tyrosine-specific transport protein